MHMNHIIFRTVSHIDTCTCTWIFLAHVHNMHYTRTNHLAYVQYSWQTIHIYIHMSTVCPCPLPAVVSSMASIRAVPDTLDVFSSAAVPPLMLSAEVTPNLGSATPPAPPPIPPVLGSVDYMVRGRQIDTYM